MWQQDAIWGSDINNPAFRALLKGMDKDVASKWPEYWAEDELLCDLYDEINGNPLHSNPPANIVDCVNVYAQCLDFVHRYPKKTDNGHIASLRQVLKEHPEDILSQLWRTFESMHPFGRRPLQQRLVLAAQKYLSALFRLSEEPDHDPIDWDDLPEDFDDDVAEERASPHERLRNLCLCSFAFPILYHCFLFSESDSVRRENIMLQEMISKVDGYDGAEVAYRIYTEKLGYSRAGPQFQVLLRSTLAPDCLLNILQDFRYIMGGHASQAMWDKALTSCLSLLGGLESLSQNMEYVRLMRFLGEPNRFIRAYFTQNFCVSKINVLKDVILNHHGAILIPLSAILSAKNHREKYWLIDDLFLIPIIISELGPVKRWDISQKEFGALLAESMRPVWKDTLDTLRELESDFPLSEHPMVPMVIEQWSLFGSTIGIQHLVHPLIGCCHAKCPLFIAKTDQPMALCSGCHQVQYCGATCQLSDWKSHNPHCQNAA
ncbi:hypothetical protein BDZ97DRAFT_1913024 [Flammula alnicola]|nr:hypothetical protein BDZ97DRAFT_1913024 [Flammula alnicola]